MEQFPLENADLFKSLHFIGEIGCFDFRAEQRIIASKLASC